MISPRVVRKGRACDGVRAGDFSANMVLSFLLLFLLSSFFFSLFFSFHFFPLWFGLATTSIWLFVFLHGPRYLKHAYNMYFLLILVGTYLHMHMYNDRAMTMACIKLS